MEDCRMAFSKDELQEIYSSYYMPLRDDKFLIRLNTDDSSRKRNDFQRDFSRIIYSSSFRRLQGKMQLLGVKSDRFFRNRLTHSLEVAQIARAIAEDIGHDIKIFDIADNVYTDDTYVVEACSLAHDIGNPPFGHKGEKVLHELCQDGYGFEGNAQTLRVLMDIEKKYANSNGLNLTLRTLLGVIKYYHKYELKNLNDTKDNLPERYDKFIYADDYDIINEKVINKDIKVRTLDVQIVDLSDEIAYAAHDLEDALSLNLFTIDDILYEMNLLKNKKDELYDYTKAYDKLKKIIDSAKQEAEKANKLKSSEEYADLFRKSLTAKIVHELIQDIRLIEVPKELINLRGTNYNKELGFKELGGLAEGLKRKTFQCINRKDTVQLYESLGKKVIMGLYEVYMQHPRYLPVEYRNDSKNEIIRKRFVIDYISGMMDTFAINSYIKFYGKGSLDSLYDKVLYEDIREL